MRWPRFSRLRRRAGTAVALGTRRLRRADLAVFHDFAPPPAGGGNQFLRALVGELERRGLRVERNRLSAATPACLCKSYNFDLARLRLLAGPGCRIVNRVDGPIGVYRGRDDGTDRRIWEANAALAAAAAPALDAGGAGGDPARARRLRHGEPARVLLERAPRSPRMRPARALRRQRLERRGGGRGRICLPRSRGAACAGGAARRRVGR